MNWFDLWIMNHVNHLVNRWWMLDVTMVQTSYTTLLTSGALMAMFWWAWIEHGKDHADKQEILVLTLFTTAFTVPVARALAYTFPYRERPIHDPRLHFHVAYTQNPDWLIHWSSYPSDHAAVLFCVAAGLWMVSRRLGACAVVYATLASLPRIYLGFHYPTDILAGALVGMGVACLAKIASLRSAVRRLLKYSNRRPAYLYAFLFVFTFSIAEMFNTFQRFLFLGDAALPRLPHQVFGGVAILLLLVGLMAAAWLIWRRHDHVAENVAAPARHHA